VADLAVLQTFEAAGRLPNFLRGESLTPALLLVSIGVAKQMLEIAVDLAQAHHTRESAAAAAAAGSSRSDSPGDGAAESASTQQEGKQQPHRHWLIPGLRAALKAVNALVPASSSSGGGAKAKGKSSSGSSMQLTRFSEAVLALADPLGMKLVQISTQPGEAGGVDKEFSGLASKNRAQSAQDKALASTVITVSQVCEHSPCICRKQQAPMTNIRAMLLFKF
jgi:hypothetical protein